MNKIWVTYIAFAVIALLHKYLRYLIQQRRLGVSNWNATLDWIFEPTTENASSWLLGTIILTWIIGAMWIDSLVVGFFDGVVGIPHHHSMAALMGYTAEQVAPTAAKWFTAKIFSKFK